MVYTTIWHSACSSHLFNICLSSHMLLDSSFHKCRDFACLDHCCILREKNLSHRKCSNIYWIQEVRERKIFSKARRWRKIQPYPLNHFLMDICHPPVFLETLPFFQGSYPTWMNKMRSFSPYSTLKNTAFSKQTNFSLANVDYLLRFNINMRLCYLLCQVKDHVPRREDGRKGRRRRQKKVPSGHIFIAYRGSYTRQQIPVTVHGSHARSITRLGTLKCFW